MLGISPLLRTGAFGGAGKGRAAFPPPLQQGCTGTGQAWMRGVSPVHEPAPKFQASLVLGMFLTC